MASAPCRADCGGNAYWVLNMLHKAALAFILQPIVALTLLLLLW